MIDFIKVVIPPQFISRLKENPLLEFIGKFNEHTGEIENKVVAEYQNLKFILFNNSEYAEIQGSLHKYSNNGNHNADDFSLLNLLDVIIEINSKFQIPIESFKISNIEFGVNIEPPIKSNLVLNNLMYHRARPFNDVFVKGGNYKQAAHKRFYLKAYNKEVQYRNKYNLSTNENMRIELKFIKMFDLKKHGLLSLSDLFNPTVLSNLHSLLIKAWNNTILFDKTIRIAALNSHHKNTKYHQWSNPNYWANLKPQRRNEQKKMYNTVVANYSDKTHSQIGYLITSKWNSLIDNSLLFNRIIFTHCVIN